MENTEQIKYEYDEILKAMSELPADEVKVLTKYLQMEHIYDVANDERLEQTYINGMAQYIKEFKIVMIAIKHFKRVLKGNAEKRKAEKQQKISAVDEFYSNLHRIGNEYNSGLSCM